VTDVTRDFRSDNTRGCSPEIAEALARAGRETASPYGADPTTERLRERCRDLFEADVAIFPVSTGTAGNALSIAALTPSWGAVFCHEDAHVHREELGAAEFFTGGAKLIPLAGPNGKLRATDLARKIEDIARGGRMAIPSCVSLTQATEGGTVYAAEEVREIADVSHRHGAGVQIDGARFANAVVATGRSPADLTWRAGVDILVLGATKNGALAAELIVVFRSDLELDLALRCHRGGQRLSKMRFLSAQLGAYLTDDLWLRNARAANEAAQRIAAGIAALPGVEIVRPVDANVLFVRLDPGIENRLRADGFLFYDWSLFGPGVVRMVTGFDTTRADTDSLVEAIRAASTQEL
jgi:threonine aldolase